MLYIKPNLKKNITGVLIITGGIGWLGLHIPYIGDYPYLRNLLAIFMILYGLYIIRGKLM